MRDSPSDRVVRIATAASNTIAAHTVHAAATARPHPIDAPGGSLRTGGSGRSACADSRTPTTATATASASASASMIRMTRMTRQIAALSLVLACLGLGAVPLPVSPSGPQAQPRPTAVPTLEVLAEATRGIATVSSRRAAMTTGAAGATSSLVPPPMPRTTFVPEWSWPLLPTPAVLRRFEKPPQRWRPGHRGVDLSAPGSAGVFVSPADGVVSFAGRVVERGVLSIDHGGGRVSSFEPVSTDLRRGQTVTRGQQIGTIAAAAAAQGPMHCTSRCLHWGVRLDGEYVDPLAFVSDRRPSVLLPLGASGSDS